METTDTTVVPSASARDLFGRMVARSDQLHLNLTQTLELAVERTRAGYKDAAEIYELEQQQWVRQAKDGGWLLLL